MTKKTPTPKKIVATPIVAKIKVTKIALVKQHFIEKKSLTSLESIKLFGDTRLAAKVHDLINLGWEFSKTTESKKDRYKNMCYFTRYTLVGLP
jgi:hypothetical protein